MPPFKFVGLSRLWGGPGDGDNWPSALRLGPNTLGTLKDLRLNSEHRQCPASRDPSAPASRAPA